MNEINFTTQSSFLHHGIQGQKWGVRNGPPYPIQDKVMKKGTQLNSVSTYSSGKAQLQDIKNKNGSLYTYNPNDEWDKNVYRGPFAKYALHRSRFDIQKMDSYTNYLKDFLNENIAEIYDSAGKNATMKKEEFIEAVLKDQTKTPLLDTKFEVIKDLKMPTSEERYQAYKDLLNSKKNKTYIQEMKNTQKYIKDLSDKGYNLSDANKQILSVDLDKVLSDDSEAKKSYKIFNTMMEATNNYSVTRDYMKSISKQYDAMVDDNNQGVYNKAHDPVVIFNAGKVLKIVSEEKNIPYTEIQKSYDIVRKELAKEGLNVAL